jgi:hypothetical protein
MMIVEITQFEGACFDNFLVGNVAIIKKQPNLLDNGNKDE